MGCSLRTGVFGVVRGQSVCRCAVLFWLVANGLGFLSRLLVFSFYITLRFRRVMDYGCFGLCAEKFCFAIFMVATIIFSV